MPKTVDKRVTWNLFFHEIDAPQNPKALSDVKPLLNRLTCAFGPRPTARLLDVKPGTVSNWSSGHRAISPQMVRRVMDVHDVMTRALQIFAPDTAMRWLVGNEPFFDGRRPIDVLAVRGVAPLIEALDNIDAGAYA